MTTSIELDDVQRAVVAHSSGALCVLGGPGTGKTTALTERFVRLALAPGLSPDRVLWLVPNRAQKMDLVDALTRRLLLDEGLQAFVELPVYTWHGLAHHLVTRYHGRLAYPEPPVLLTSPEQWADVYEALAGESEVNWPRYRALLRSPGFADEIVDFSIRVEQRLLDPPDLERLAAERPEYSEVVRFYLKHRQRLRTAGRVDYPTLLRDAVELIAQHDDVRAALQDRFPHVLVDDGQELAPVQQRLLVFLTGVQERAAEARSVVVAADPDSAIETFRGADPDWLERFGDEFGGSAPLVLPASYRLGSDAGRRAVGVVARNEQRAHRPAVFAGATRLEVRALPTLAAEVEAAVRALRAAHIHDGVGYDDMAILLTSPTAMLPPLERALRALEVPYRVSVPDRPLDREPGVRALRDLARWALEDDGDALAGLLHSPLAGLRDADVRGLERTARVAGVDLGGVVEHPSALPARVAERLAELIRLRDVLLARRDARADEAFWGVWNEAAYYRRLVERVRDDPEDPGGRDIDALVAFARSLGRFVERRRGSGTLSDYLEAIGRADFGSDPWLPPDRRRGGVELLSFHAAKGRQWDVVAVCGCVEGILPKGRRARGLFDPYFLDESSPVERIRRNDAEDRRVFYVAITRAARHCLVTTSPGPSRKGRPSRFVRELGDDAASGAEQGHAPLTLAEAASVHRSVLADTQAPPPARLAAVGALARICRIEPGCRTAQPSEWWWRWDWTEGAISLLDQRGARGDGLPEGRLRTSYSRVSKYDNCGLAYLMSVVLGLDPDTSHNMAFGTWIHQIFEDCEKNPSPEAMARGRRRLTNRDMVHRRFRELFDESVFPNRAVARQFYRDGQLMLDRYCEHLRPGRALLAEHRFDVDFQGHRITGRIDRVDRAGKGVRVSDYKTSRRPAGWDEARDSLQLAIYFHAARSDAEIAGLGPPVCAQLVYPGEMARGEVAKRVQNPEESERVLERLPRLLDGILNEDFRPSPQADCTWCKFKPLCPLWPEGKELLA